MPLFGRKVDQLPAAIVTQREPLADPPEVAEDGLRSMEAHRDYLLSHVQELPAFNQQLLDALGLALCEDVSSEINLPRFDNSAMDGYAVRAADVFDATTDKPVSLPVVGEIAAGQSPSHRLSPGTAMKIMTGAPVPENANAIVAYENTDRGSSDVSIRLPSEVGQHIRRTGDDIEAGDRLFGIGDQLSARDLAVLAGIGRASVLVRPRPRVVVISTGSELVEPGAPLTQDHQIFDSNSYLLAAAAKAAGAQVFRVGRVTDDPEALKHVINDSLIRADLILTTGGVSQGDYDIVKAVMPELGACDFAGVAMQPGKPQGFGLIGDDQIPMIMLPGNPVSAFVSFEAFVRPVIRKLMGIDPYVRVPVECRAADSITSIRGRRQFARGVVTTATDGVPEVHLAGRHGSHLMGDLAQANALVILAEDVDFVAAGDPVDVWLIDDGRA